MARKRQRNNDSIAIIGLIVIIISLHLMTSYSSEVFAGGLYLTFGIVGIAVAFISRFNGWQLYRSNLLLEIFIGIFLGISFTVVMGSLAGATPVQEFWNNPFADLPFAIGLSEFLVVVILAPFGETLLMLVIRATAIEVVKSQTRKKKVSFAIMFLIALGSALIFSKVHNFGSGNQTAFISAVVFSVIAGMLMMTSESIIMIISMHFTINGLIYASVKSLLAISGIT